MLGLNNRSVDDEWNANQLSQKPEILVGNIVWQVRIAWGIPSVPNAGFWPVANIILERPPSARNRKFRILQSGR
jgi:hypothetical protein